MNVGHIYKWCAVGTLLALGLSFGLYKTFAQPAAPAPATAAVAEDGVQVLTRGPVHEAFAETVTYDRSPPSLPATDPACSPESPFEYPSAD